MAELLWAFRIPPVPPRNKDRNMYVSHHTPAYTQTHPNGRTHTQLKHPMDLKAACMNMAFELCSEEAESWLRRRDWAFVPSSERVSAVIDDMVISP